MELPIAKTSLPTLQRKCGNCVATEELSLRYLACVSTTQYSGGQGKPYTHIDDAKVWEVALCKACAPLMRRRCVREALTFNLGGIALGLVSLCGAALALALFDYVQSASSFGYAPRGVIENVIAAPKTFLHIAYLGAVAFIAGLGVILVVVYLLRTPSSIATFIHAYTTSDLSERAAATAYVALAERILKVRYRKENRQSHEFESCEFPIQKSIENLSEVERSKAMKHNGVVKKRARSILPQVAPTRAALVSMLPGEIQQALSASQAVGRG